METKSRYEVISDLEKRKRDLILERDSFPDKISAKKRHIKLMKRELEDAQEELEEYEQSVDTRKSTINALIVSLDESLKRMEGSFSQSQKK